MASLLLPIIYLAFISLGLPDSLLGAAWPIMYQELGATVSWAGIISMVIAAGTVVSSLLSERLNVRFGAAKITAVSVLTTAVALFGFSISNSFWLLCLWAVPYGLGAGSVDAVLNNYVALHYKARHMSWLHCMWGVGCSIGPMVMGYAISAGSWNMGYGIISIFQIALTAVLFFSIPLWKRPARESTQTDAPRHHSIRELTGLPGVREVLVCFFCYCALESTVGMWAASYCTLFRGIPAQQAARWASLFYIGITVGRFVCGFISMKINDQNMIRLGQGVMALGTVAVLMPFGDGPLFAGLILIGLGCAPVYPSIIHETPANFGPEVSQGIIGVQMACAYIGSCLMPPIFGFLAEKISFAIYPLYLAVILLLMIFMSERLHVKTAVRRSEYTEV